MANSLAAERRTEVTEPRNLHLAYADALRATAIFVVVLHHLVYLTRPAIGHHRPYEFGYLGIWGVNCFFVLSGYLLGRPYIAMLLDPARKMPSTKLFYTRRFLRIYPLYAVAIVFSVVLVTLTYHAVPSFADISTHLLMLHTLDIRHATTVNGPLWTMAVDIEFYLVLPLAAAALAWLLRGRDRAVRRSVVFAVLALTFVGSIVFRYVMYSHFPNLGTFTADVVYIRNVVGFSGTFALGMFLAAVALIWHDRMPRKPVLFTSLVVVGVAIAFLQLVTRVDADPNAPETLARIVWLTFNETLAALSVSLIFFGLSEGRLPLLTRLTGTTFVTTAAALSYAVYLVHWPIIDGVSRALHRPQGLGAFFEVGVVSVALVAVVAYVLHRFVERPILDLKDTMRDARDAVPIAR